jgi:hypothetical protein
MAKSAAFYVARPAKTCNVAANLGQVALSKDEEKRQAELTRLRSLQAINPRHDDLIDRDAQLVADIFTALDEPESIILNPRFMPQNFITKQPYHEVVMNRMMSRHGLFIRKRYPDVFRGARLTDEWIVHRGPFE